MGDIKLFRTADGEVSELEPRTATIEKSLQNQIENNMEEFLGVRFLASEHSTGRTHGGRIDSLGIDENNCPVIVEYKRSSNENVINQGLFYLDWLLDHKAEFEMLVMNTFGAKVAKDCDWGSPRLLCIASDFKKYDEYAVQQINRNIDLLRYRRYSDDLLLFELVNSYSSTSIGPKGGKKTTKGSVRKTSRHKTVGEYLEQAPLELKDLFESFRAFCLNLGDDVSEKELKAYFAFRRMKNFACVEVHTRTNKLLVFLKINPDNVQLQKGFSRDVRNIGHFGTGDLELTIGSLSQLEEIQPLIERSYEKN